MPFAPHIAQILEVYGVQPETKAALFDLYVSMGDEVLEVFSDMAEDADASQLVAASVSDIRQRVVERYLTRNHPKWVAGKPTASLWHPRELEGRASGVVVPLGEIGEASRCAVGPDQPIPDGFLVMGRNAHFGGRQETISFDVIPRELADAVAIGTAEGQQHTVPGSIGETSGTHDAAHGIALIWEVQPNVYKPAGDRNRTIARSYRRHRNWHLITLAAALDWLRGKGCATYVLRGDALAPTHEVNPLKPVSASIAANHDRTVAEVTRALELELRDVNDEEEFLLLESMVMNHALRKHVLRHGAAHAMRRIAFAPRQ